MFGVPTSKPGVIVPLVSSAAWIFCLSSAVFAEMPGVRETDVEIRGVGVEIRPVSPPCPLRRV